MNKRMKIVGLIAIMTLVTVIGGLGTIVGPGIWMGVQVAHARTRLLCETDHQALREACRTLSREALKSDPKGVVYNGWKVRRLPEPIRALRPDYVTVGQDGWVVIGMGNTFHDLGVWAFPEGCEKPALGYGDRKLLEGLWYYDEEYRYDREGYDKVVDGLLSKNRKLKKPTGGSDPNS